MRNRKIGFTLTELLVVISVIIILLSMMVVGIEGAYNYAMRLRCQHTMEHLWNACVLYATNHRNLLPPIVVEDVAWYNLLVSTGYIDNPKGITCPTSDLPSTATVGSTVVPNAAELKEAQTKTLDYLKSVQNAAGYWGSYKGATTGLCVAAFLGAGVTENHPVYGETLRKAMDYLTNTAYYTAGWWNQDGYNGYVQGIVLLALGDAVKYGRVERARATAETALVPHLQRQTESALSGYHYSSSGTDMSATAWAYQGIAACRNANISINAPGITWETSDARSQLFFNGSIRYNALFDSAYGFTGSGGDRMTAANTVIRLLYGHKPEKPSWYTEPANYEHITAPDPTLAHGTNNNERLYFQYRYNTRMLAGQTERQHIRYIKNTWSGLRTGGPSTANPDVYGAYYYTLGMYLYGGEDWLPYAEVLSGLIINNWVQANGSVPGTYSPGGDTSFATALVLLQIDMMVGSSTAGSKYYISGSHSFGYNSHIAGTTRTPGATTIAFIDYMRSTVSGGDPESLLAPRHSGKINVIYCDGHSETVYPEEITTDGFIREDLLSRDELR